MRGEAKEPLRGEVTEAKLSRTVSLQFWFQSGAGNRRPVPPQGGIGSSCVNPVHRKLSIRAVADRARLSQNRRLKCRMDECVQCVAA